MIRVEPYYQPRLPNAFWGRLFDVELVLNTQGDVFVNFSKVGDEETEITYPIKYCNEAILNTSLGIIGCKAGRIDEAAFVKEMLASADDEDWSSDERVCARETKLAFDESVREKPYGNTLYTYQGQTTVRYEPGDMHFSFQLEHRLADTPALTLLDLEMIPVITDKVAAPKRGISAEYFAFARKVADTISHLWLPTTSDN